jgi:hypothetical protein
VSLSEGIESACGDAACDTTAFDYRDTTAGELVSVSTPEPSSLAFLGLGLVGLVGATSRKRLHA